LRIEISNYLVLLDGSPGVFRAVKNRLTIENPLWLENERMGRWNGGVERILRYYSEAGDLLILPRGFVRQAISICRQYGEKYEIFDKRRTLPEVDYNFIGTLKPFQKKAVSDVLKHEFGTLSAATGSGKTVMALAIIAERRQPALIIVHTKELLEQWIARIETFLGIPRAEIGVIGAGKKTVGEQITVALVQTLYKCVDDFSAAFGFLIVDECHRAPSRTFIDAVTEFDSRYMLGLSATPWRRDKLSRLIYWHMGDLVHEVNKNDLEENGDILRPEVITRKTSFYPEADPVEEYQEMLKELTEDLDRNRLIASDVAAAAKNKNAGVALVLSDRKNHCHELQFLLASSGIDAEVLTGDLPATKRQAIVEKLNAGQIRVLIATGQLIGEGFDCRDLSTLFLATPIKFDGRVLQYLGRVLRPAPGKDRAIVYDYIDSNVGVLMAAAQSRARVYGKVEATR